MSKYVDKFLGSRKIIETKILERTTHLLQQPVYEVKFQDKTSKEVPGKILDDLTTEKKVDETTFRDDRGKFIIADILGILLESEIELEHIEYLLSRTATSINETVTRAEKKLWNKELHNRTLADVQAIVIKDEKVS